MISLFGINILMLRCRSRVPYHLVAPVFWEQLPGARFLGNIKDSSKVFAL